MRTVFIPRSVKSVKGRTLCVGARAGAAMRGIGPVQRTCCARQGRARALDAQGSPERSTERFC